MQLRRYYVRDGLKQPRLFWTLRAAKKWWYPRRHTSYIFRWDTAHGRWQEMITLLPAEMVS
jgi:hypothetical protein